MTLRALADAELRKDSAMPINTAGQ